MEHLTRGDCVLQALKSAKAGLDYCYQNFEFGRDGNVMPFGEAMDKFQDRIFKTGFVKGTAPKPKSEVKVGHEKWRAISRLWTCS